MLVALFVIFCAFFVTFSIVEENEQLRRQLVDKEKQLQGKARNIAAANKQLRTKVF